MSLNHSHCQSSWYSSLGVFSFSVFSSVLLLRYLSHPVVHHRYFFVYSWAPLSHGDGQTGGSRCPFRHSASSSHLKIPYLIRRLLCIHELSPEVWWQKKYFFHFCGNRTWILGVTLLVRPIFFLFFSRSMVLLPIKTLTMTFIERGSHMNSKR